MFLLHTTVQAPLAHGGWMAPCTYLLVYWSSRCWGVHHIVQDGAPPPITLPLVRKQKGRVCAPSTYRWPLKAAHSVAAHIPLSRLIRRLCLGEEKVGNASFILEDEKVGNASFSLGEEKVGNASFILGGYVPSYNLGFCNNRGKKRERK